MKEATYNGTDVTRFKRAFNWVITFRDFPVGCYQTFDSDTARAEAVSLYLRGRAECHFADRRGIDRVPGVLSTEQPEVLVSEEFKLVYVEPTTRICIPAYANRKKLPVVEKILMSSNETRELQGRILVCTGSISVSNKIFNAEQTFEALEPKAVTAIQDVILLKFLT